MPYTIFLGLILTSFFLRNKNPKKWKFFISVLNALYLEKWGEKIHNFVLLLDFLAVSWLYRTHVLE